MRERKDFLVKILPAISAGRLAVFRWGSSLSVIVATLTVSAQTNFCKAITSKTSVTLHGCMVVDSFNSLDPSHSTNGKYDAAKRLDGADIACVSDTLSVITDTGNTRVYGHFGTGPSGKVTLSGTASVGSIAWVNGGSRGIQPGCYANDLQLEIPDAVLPNITFSTLSQSSSRVGGTNYNYVLGTGNYKSSTALSLKGQNMCINGKVTIYLPSGLQISGQGYIYVAPGASLTIYLGGQSQMAGGGTINGSGFATNCSLIGLPTCTSIQYTGGSGFVGIIYAPNADVNVSGGGSQTLNFVGSLVAKTASVTGNYQFHYDQALCSNFQNRQSLSGQQARPCAPVAPSYLMLVHQETG